MIKLPATEEGRFRLSAIFVLAGLAIEFLTLWEAHPFTFLAFSFGGMGLVGIGILIYLWTVLRRSPA